MKTKEGAQILVCVQQSEGKVLDISVLRNKGVKRKSKKIAWQFNVKKVY